MSPPTYEQCVVWTYYEQTCKGLHVTCRSHVDKATVRRRAQTFRPPCWLPVTWQRRMIARPKVARLDLKTWQVSHLTNRRRHWLNIVFVLQSLLILTWECFCYSKERLLKCMFTRTPVAFYHGNRKQLLLKFFPLPQNRLSYCRRDGGGSVEISQRLLALQRPAIIWNGFGESVNIFRYKLIVLWPDYRLVITRVYRKQCHCQSIVFYIKNKKCYNQVTDRARQYKTVSRDVQKRPRS